MAIGESIFVEQQVAQADPLDAFLSGEPREPVQTQFVEDEYGFPTTPEPEEGGAVENFEPFGVGVNVSGDLDNLIDQLEGSVLDEIELYARDTVLGSLLPEQTDLERESMQRSAIASMERGSTVGNFALGTAIGLIGDLPVEIALATTTGGIANLSRRAATIARASDKFAGMANRLRLMGGADNAIRMMDDMANATSKLSRTFMFGPEGRVSDSAIKRFAAESLGAGISEGVSASVIGQEPEEVAQRILGGLALGGVFAESIYRLAGGFNMLSRVLAEKGYSKEVIDAVEKNIQEQGDHIVPPVTRQVDPDQVAVKVNGEESNFGQVSKAVDSGERVVISGNEFGEISVIPKSESVNVVRDAVRSAATKFGLDINLYRKINSNVDGFAIGNKVFIDADASNADFVRLLGHEIFHVAINKMDVNEKSRIFKEMRDMLSRNGIDTVDLNDRKLVEEFFADAGGRSDFAFKQLTANLANDSIGRKALRKFQYKVREFIKMVREAVGQVTERSDTGAPRFDTTPELKEIDKFADDLLRSLLIKKEADANASIKADVEVKPSEVFEEDAGETGVIKASQSFDSPEAKTEGLIGEDGRVIKTDIRDVQSVNQSKKAGTMEVIELAKKNREDVKAIVPPKNKWAKKLMSGVTAKGRQLTGYLRGVGLNNMEKVIKQAHQESARFKNAIRDKVKPLLDQLSEINEQRMANTSTSKFYGGEVTDGNKANLIFTARDMDGGKEVDKDGKVSGVDKDSGFGYQSGAYTLLKQGFADSNGKVHKLSAEQIREMAEITEFDDVYAVVREYYENAGRIGDLAAMRAGNDPVTDPTITAYNPIRTVEMGKSTPATDNPFSYSQASLWKKRVGPGSPVNAMDNFNPLSFARNTAERTADLYGDTGITNAKTALFGADGVSDTGMSPVEFLESDLASDFSKDQYQKLLAEGMAKAEKVKDPLKLKPSKSELEIKMEAAEKAVKAGKGLKAITHKTDAGDFDTVGYTPKNRSDELTKKLGAEMSGEISKRIDEALTSKRTDEVLGMIASYAMRLRRVAAMGWNTTALIQVASAPYSGVRLRLGNKLNDTAKKLFEPNELVNAVGKSVTDKAHRDAIEAEALEFIPAFKERITSGNVNIEFAELTSDPKNMAEFKKMWRQAKRSEGFKGNFDSYLNLIEQSMTPIRAVDRMTITGLAGQAMKAADAMGLEKSSDEWVAKVNEIFMDILETQPSSIKGFKNDWQISNNPVAKAFTMFTGATGPMYDLMHEAALKAAQGDTEMARELLVPMLMSVGYVAAAGATLGATKNFIFQTEKDRQAIENKFGGVAVDFVNRAVESTIGTIPLVGPIGSGAFSQVTTGSSFDAGHPLFDYANDATKFVGQLSDLEVGKAFYTIGKNVLPYPIPRAVRRLGKEVTGD